MSDTTDNKNFVITIFVVIALVVILSKLLGKSEEEEEEEKSKRSRQKLYNEVEPSFRDFTYKDYADTLETALLKQSDEDEDAVYGVFEKMKNISDVNKLIDAFAHRRQMFSTLYISLPQAITTYFDAFEKAKLNRILQKKGIAYSF